MGVTSPGAGMDPATPAARRPSQGQTTPGRRTGSQAGQSPFGQKTPVSQGSGPGKNPVTPKVPHRGFARSPPMSQRNVGPAMDLDDDDDDEGADEGTFLYGTDLSEHRVAKDIHRFVKRFKLPEAEDGDRAHYLKRLDAAWEEAEGRT